MLVSICMMVKNEAINLPRCLESLKPLMDQLDSELIIVDTGSEDETVDIAKQYTSKVFFHKWNNNFSEMRNITMDYATGDWIFIIDADEALVNPSSIISFFKMDIRKFNGASVRLDNIVKKNGNLGSTISTIRFFRNNGKFKYYGSVHNLLHIDGNICELESKLLHYGYITDDIELMDAKFNRTRNLLIDELEKNPKNIYYQFQLATSYEMHKDVELAKLHYEKAYLLIKESNENQNQFLYLWGPLAKILILFKEFQRAVEVCHEGLLLADDYVDLYYFLGIAYSGLSNWDLAIANLEKFLGLLEISETLAIRKNPAVQLYSLGSKLECLNNVTQAYIVANEWMKAKNASNELIASTEESSELFVNGINYYIRACVQLRDVDSILELYRKYPERSDNLDIIVYSCVNKMSMINQSEDQLFKGLCKLPSKLGYIYSKLRNYLFNEAENEKSDAPDYLDFIEKNVEEALYLALIENKKIDSIFSNIDEQKLMELIANVHQKYDDLQLVVERYIHQIEEDKQFETINMLRILFKYLMIVNFDSETMIAYMDKYYNAGIRFLKFKYNTLFLSRENLNHYLNTEEQFLSVVCKMIDNKYSKEYFLIMCDLYPEWKYQIAKWFESKIGNNSQVETHRSVETDQMISELVRNIKFLMNEGHESDAHLIIQEMKKIYNFTDYDIEKLLID